MDHKGDTMQHGLALDKASVRRMDANGFLHVDLSNISKATVNPYYGREIPNYQALGLHPDKVYNLLRDPRELAKAAATFNNLPILDKHIPISAELPSRDQWIGSMGTDAEFVAPYLRNSAVIWTKDGIEEIESERRKEWSCGYRYRADMTPGVYSGLRYDGIMRDIAGNHVTLVEEGRAGPDVVVGDSALREPDMKHKAMLAAATSILALVAPKLAMDEGIELDDVLQIMKASHDLAAEGGEEAPAAEDEDLNAANRTDEDGEATAEDEGDPLAKVLAFLKGKLSDEDMAALAQIAQGGAQDEDPDNDEDEDAMNKPAMDAAISKARAETIREMNALREAERAVAPIVGEVLGMDSAEDVYRFALKQRGVATDGVHPSALKAMVALISAAPASTPSVALDHAGAKSDFAKRFPNATPLLHS